MVFALRQHESAISIQVSPTPWTPFPPSFLPHSSRLSQSTSFGFGFPVSHIRLPLALRFTYGNVYVSILFFKLLHFCPVGNTSNWTCPAGYCCCSVTKPCLTLCEPMGCSTPCLPIPHHLSEFAHVHVHWVMLNGLNWVYWWCYPVISSSSSAFNLSQQQRLYQWFSSLH